MKVADNNLTLTVSIIFKEITHFFRIFVGKINLTAHKNLIEISLFCRFFSHIISKNGKNSGFLIAFQRLWCFIFDKVSILYPLNLPTVKFNTRKFGQKSRKS
jgi:hypothetical protein